MRQIVLYFQMLLLYERKQNVAQNKNKNLHEQFIFKKKEDNLTSISPLFKEAPP